MAEEKLHEKLTEQEATCLIHHLPRPEHNETYKNPVLKSARDKLRKVAYPTPGEGGC